MTRAFNMDCMEAMKEYPDKYFDLAVVDPPYGDGIDTSGEAADTHTHTHSRSDATVGTDGTSTAWNRFGQRFDRHKIQTERSPSQQLPQERERRRSGHLVSGLRKGDSQPDWWNLGGEVRKKIIEWDTAPEQSYFDELFRVSRNQIIWGGQLFPTSRDTVFPHLEENKCSA